MSFILILAPNNDVHIDDSKDKDCHKIDYDSKVYGFYTKKVE